MTDIAIRVENLGKRYRIGRRERYRTLRDAITETAAAPFRWLTHGTSEPDYIWALKGFSCEIPRGEVVGIIGCNGAGKSTLLKVLSRITEPTEGYAEIHGRVGSLLEVGTGFHPELTGRENVYLNGTILGMRRAEIAAKFDEIVSFAEIERFLDTPVKHYSSGMYMRLAFAVAAHLDPEILIVDEVLAVGDAQFQKKCLGKMEDVAAAGRTVVFVSHNMNAVQRLCSAAIVLDRGTVVATGTAVECVRRHLRTESQGSGIRKADLSPSPGVKRHGNGAARFESAELLSAAGDPISVVHFGQPVTVRLTVRTTRPLSGVLLGFSFVANDGTELQGSAAHDGGISTDLRTGIQVFDCRVDPMLLTPGRYFLRGAVFSRTEVYDHVDEFLPFEVTPSPYKRDGRTPANHYVGYVYYPYRWSAVPGEEEADLLQVARA